MATIEDIIFLFFIIEYIIFTIEDIIEDLVHSTSLNTHGLQWELLQNPGSMREFRLEILGSQVPPGDSQGSQLSSIPAVWVCCKRLSAV